MKTIFKKLKNNILFRNGILFTFFSFLNSGINFLLLFILAKFLSQESYGHLNLFTVFMSLFVTLISFNTPGFVSVSFFKYNKIQLRKIVTTVLLVSIIALLFFLIILFILSPSLNGVIGFSYFYQFLALFICFFQVFNNLNLDIWRLEEKATIYGVYTFVIVSLNCLLSLCFILNENMDWYGRVYALLIINFIFFILALVFLIKRKYLYIGIPSKYTFRKLLKFGIPLIPHNISIWLRQGVDRNIINLFFSASYVGIFSFAFNFSNIIIIIGSAFNATNSVYIYKMLSEKHQEHEIKKKLVSQTKKMILFFAIITVFIIIGTYIFISFVMPKYINSLPYVIPLCAAGFFQCIYFLFVNYIFYFQKTKGLMFITFSISLVHIFLSYLFTKYGIIYTAYITLFSNFLISMLVFYYSQQIFPLFKLFEKK